MEAIALILTKFSEEVIAAQLAALFFASAVALYWLVLRKKKKESAEWVPAALVRAYLDRVRADEREIRLKLFGEDSGAVLPAAGAPLATALSTVTTVADPNLVKELEALRGQLAVSDQRAMEFDRMMNALRAEKAALEEKLKNAGAPAAAGAPDPVVTKELEDLKARLQEYEVIEDDLANLKKFQKENEQLRQKVEQYEKGGAPAPAASAEPKMVVSGAAEKPAMTLVSGGAAAEPAAPVAEATPAAPPAEPAPAPVAAAPAPAPEANTNVLQPVTPTESAAPPPTTVEGALAAKAAEAAPAAAGAAAPAGEAAAPEKSAKQKEEELLSEFEKMLAS